MRKVIVILLAVSMAGVLSAQPQTTTTRAMSLTDCVQEALMRNLDVQIERINPQISSANLRGAYGGWDPNLSFGYQHDYNLAGGGFNAIIGTNTPAVSSSDDSFTSGISGTLPWGLGYSLFGNLAETFGEQGPRQFDSTGGRAGVNLTQPLLKNFLVDGIRLNISVAKNRLKYSELGLRAKVMDVVTGVENAYYDLIFAKESVKVQEKALQLAEQLLAENKKRVEVGTMAPLDEKQAESQVAGSRADLLSAQQVLEVARNALRTLITDNYRELHDVVLEPTEQLAAPVQSFNIQESWSKGLAQRPELLQARLDAERWELQLKYDRNQLLPDLSVIGTYGHGASGVSVVEFDDGFGDIRRGDHPFYTYGAKFSIPLGNRAARNNYRATKLSVEQIKLMLKRIEQGILVEIDNDVTSARVSLERVTSTREARLYAEAALDAERKKLENGKSTSFVVLELQKNLTAARSEEIRALTAYNRSLANLARSEGSTLDRRAINLQVQ